jgi:hypothetical protein
MPELGQHDAANVERFLGQYRKPTGEFRTQRRIEELDRRIAAARLSLADAIETVKRLAPRADFTDWREELRLERLICSLSASNLPAFKFALDYDSDYKDLEEYVFHDIDDEDSQQRLVDHFLEQARGAPIGIKLLTDVDDTIYANLVEDRYPKKTFYPGVLELYDAIKQEPFDVDWIPVTTLSARPNPVAGTLEEGSLRSLTEHTHGRLRPSALSGKAISSVLGTIETLSREKRAAARSSASAWWQGVLGNLSASLPNFEHLEREIGRVKFNNFKRFAKVYPEYRFVFFGDSGQADALTAALMVADEHASSRVVTTFIHDLGDTARSPSYQELDRALVDARPPRVIVFRNHIQAAVQGHAHYPDLVSGAALARVTRAALTQLDAIEFPQQDRRNVLEAQYKEDALDAVKALERASGTLPGEDVRVIRELLEHRFRAAR